MTNVTEGFKDRLASYALNSPSTTRTVDVTLTPAPEVSIPQSSPTQRRRKQRSSLRIEEEGEESSDEEVRPRATKRTLTTVITASQLERVVASVRDVEGGRGRGRGESVQMSLREHFLRKVDDSEVRGSRNDNDVLGLLSSDQVESMVTEMETEQVVEEDQIEEDGNDEVDELQTDSVELDPVNEAVPTDDIPTDPVDAMDEIIESGNELPPDIIVERPAAAAPKSERNLFKSRQRNAVHNLKTTTNLTLEAIRKNRPLHSHQPDSHSGSITRKQYNTSNEKAEERLSLTVSKTDFAKMRVVGQFNLGFIITVREREDGIEDVFIIDQHASDEKYNFERLQSETTFSVQALARPQQLELTAVEEAIVLDHLDVFKLNGFEIRPMLDELPGKRCFLHAIPMSGNTVFTLSDLEELIHLVQLHPDKKSIRCSKARAMFAMRACRSSIMIGKALSEKMMEKVVRNLGGLDKPWSCPHGRPTMRHLTELDGWTSWDGDCK